MANENYKNFEKGIAIVPKSGSSTSAEPGELEVLSSDNKLRYHNGSVSDPVVTETATQTLTNKTIDGDNNTLQDIPISALKTVLAEANEFIVRDGSGAVVSDKVVPTGAVVGTSDSQTLTNKTVDASSNTISNITNSNLSGSAGITNANLATMATARVKGNLSGSTAVPSDLTATDASTATSVVTRDSNGDSSFKGVKLDGATSGTVELNAADTTTSYALKMPPAQGSSGQTMLNDGAGNLSWGTTSLADGSVTNAKLANMAAATIKSNPTSSSAVPQDVSISSGMFYRNKIINGGMRIDQRNSGSAITAFGFPVDRFTTSGSGGGAITSQRTTTTPTGFVNSLQCTVATADASIAAGDFYDLFTNIEGNNISELSFGTANAQTFTLSFWVRSSITGTYSVAFRNESNNRSYVAEYTISVANTFEYKTITVSGDTSGTWDTGTGRGLIIVWSLGNGSNFTTTAGSWQAGAFTRTSGSTQWISTLGATFFLTGVQLEQGSIATPFERRPQTIEEQLCMRYYERQTGLNIWGYSPNTADVTRWGNVPYLVQKRSTPLVTGTVTGSNLSGGATFTPRGTTMLNFNQNTTAANSGNAYLTAFEANAEF